MANISDCSGKVNFIFTKMDENFEEVNEEVNKEEEITQEEKLKIVNTFCEIINKETACSDYGFYMPGHISLNDFSKDGNIYNLNFSACGRWVLENNFELFDKKGFLYNLIKANEIVKNLEVKFIYNEYEPGNGVFNINNEAVIKYNNLGEPSINCICGEPVNITLDNLSEYGFENEVEYKLENLYAEVLNITEAIKDKLSVKNFNISKELKELEIELNI